MFQDLNTIQYPQKYPQRVAVNHFPSRLAFMVRFPEMYIS